MYVALRAAASFKPDIFVILGDFADGESLSGHAPSTAHAEKSFKAEVDEVSRHLDMIESFLPKHADKYYVKGNHENRLERLLADKAPALFDCVNYADMLKLAERGWSVTEYKETLKLGKLNITHDTGTAGMNAHRTAATDHMGSTVIGHCLPIEYEVLTQRGPVSLADIVIGDEVLAYDPHTRGVIYTRVNDKVRWKYKGQMAVFDNQVIAQSMTSEHHLFTQDGRYVPVRDASWALTKDDLVRWAFPVERSEYNVSDEMLRLVVAFAADGNLASAGSVRFHFVKERKVQRLTSLWKAAGGTIDWSTPTAAGRTKTKGLDRETQIKLIELCPDKVLPSWLLQLSARQRQIVVDELELWDGSVIRHYGIDAGGRQFCSYKPEEVNLVQTLLMQHGIRSRTFNGGRAVGYDLREPSKTTDAIRKLGQSMNWMETDREVGCISTSLKNFFVRTSEGSVELTGNTHRMAYEVKGKHGGEPYLAAMFGWLGDPKKIDYVHQVKAAHWVHGFGIGWMEESGIIHVQPVPIVRGACVVNGELIR